MLSGKSHVPAVTGLARDAVCTICHIGIALGAPQTASTRRHAGWSAYHYEPKEASDADGETARDMRQPAQDRQ